MTSNRPYPFLLLIFTLALAPPAPAQPEGEENQPATEQVNLIQINFPDDLELNVLIEFVSERLKINILYDAQLVRKRVTIKAPNKVPEDALLDILESALRMNGLALTTAQGGAGDQVDR